MLQLPQRSLLTFFADCRCLEHRKAHALFMCLRQRGCVHVRGLLIPPPPPPPDTPGFQKRTRLTPSFLVPSLPQLLGQTRCGGVYFASLYGQWTPLGSWTTVRPRGVAFGTRLKRLLRAPCSTQLHQRAVGQGPRVVCSLGSAACFGGCFVSGS